MSPDNIARQFVLYRAMQELDDCYVMCLSFTRWDNILTNLIKIIYDNSDCGVKHKSLSGLLNIAKYYDTCE